MPRLNEGAPGDYVLTFGKHSGLPLKKIPLTYLDWLRGEMDGENRPSAIAIRRYLDQPGMAKMGEQAIEAEAEGRGEYDSEARDYGGL